MRSRWMLIALASLLALEVKNIAAQSCSGTTTVTTAPSGCATWTGDIIVPTAGSSGPDEIDFDGLEEIQGSLNITDQYSLVTLSSDTLHTVTERLVLQNLFMLHIVDLPELTEVGDLVLSSLPALSQPSLLESLHTLSSLQIINSASGTLRGFNLETIREVRITNNPFLQEVTLQPYNVTGNISIAANGQELKLSMPNLESAQGIALSNCTSISIPSLRTAGGIAVVWNAMEELDAMPLLSEVNGNLGIAHNSNLTRIALPGLKYVYGDLEIQNNTELRSLDELYTLEGVGGDIPLEGPFDSVGFPNLEDIGGAFELNSTGSLRCSDLDEWRAQNVNGMYSCHSAAGADSTQSGADANNVGVPIENQETGLGTGARVGIGLGVGGGVGAIVGGIVGYLFQLRARARKAKYQDGNASSGATSEKPELDGSGADRGVLVGNDGQKVELETPHTVGEMGVGGEAQELPSKHGASELDDRDVKGQPEGSERTHELPGNDVSAGDRKDN